MTERYDAALNKALDEVLEKRRSIRSFKPEAPPREYVEQVIRAGLLAPYAGLAGRSLAETRRFAVLTRGTPAMAAVDALLKAQIKKNLGRLKLLSAVVPHLRRNAGPFVKVLEGAAAGGVPALRTAPYVIVVGERKGFPPVERQSLACALENMWLKATALGLGFQLVSAFQVMSGNGEFMDLAGLPRGEFVADGCALGYPDQEPGERARVDQSLNTKWL